MNLTVGTVLQNGKYLLSDVLGQGQLCTTLQATQAYLNQTVVLKTLNPDVQNQTDIAPLKQRFIEEARRFAQCQHPGLVRVVDLFIEAWLPFVVMDYVAGQSLASLVQAREPLSEAQAIQYVRQIGSALSVIHRNGLVHQAVSPENLIRPQGADFVVLVGFGIMRQVELGAANSGATNLAATNHPYAAIEQLQPSAKLSAATDIYALAGTLYFLVTGQNPIAATLRDQIPLPSPRKLRPTLSAAIEAAILSGLEMHSQSRPQTIAAWFSLLPGSESLPPVSAFTNPEIATIAQVPQTSGSANGSHSAPPAPQPAPQATRVVASHSPSVPAILARPEKSRFSKAIVATATIAGTVGLGLGLLLRFSAASGIGPRIFHTQQSFPPLKDWPGSAEPTAAPLAPLPSPPAVRRNLELPPPRPIPSPVISSPSPAPQPSPEATGEAFPSPSPEIPEAPSTVPKPLPQATASPQPIPSSSPLSPAQPEPSPVTKSKEGGIGSGVR
ncbi:MAG: serine/threonine-protein kinase [Kovacikia sp.]